MPNNEKKELSESDPVIGEDECEAIMEVIENGWITMGEMVSRFETAFSGSHGARCGIAVSSATAGLHLALEALNVGPGDEVLVPALTFVATVNAILYVGAKPVFVDIESTHRPHIDIEDAESKLSPRTKAVMLVHYGGWLCPMEKWKAFSDTHGLFLIEDAAHAPGLVHAAGHGDIAVYSFYGNKNMTTAEGGMVTVDDDSLAGDIRRLRSHGMTSNTLDRYKGHAFSYDVVALGYNYRMDEIRASIGLVQLEKLVAQNVKRNELLVQYRELLDESSELSSIAFTRDEMTTAHICPVIVSANKERDDMMQWLRDSGIHTSIHYPPVHLFTYYRGRLGEVSLPNTETYALKALSLPLHPKLSLDDVTYVCERIFEKLYMS